METKKIIEILEKFAPLSYSDAFVKAVNGYDNSGLIVEGKERVEKILFSLDFSERAVEKAVSVGADMIITHHPAIYRPIPSITSATPLGRAISDAIKHNITVYSAHLNLDCAPLGIDASLASIFGKNSQILIPMEGETVGYGRLTEMGGSMLKNLAQRYKKATGSSRVLCYGNMERIVTRVASFSGGGGGMEELLVAAKAGAELMVSSDFAHHVILEAHQRGIALMQVTHYSAENYGFNQFFNLINHHLGGLPTEYFVEEDLL